MIRLFKPFVSDVAAMNVQNVLSSGYISQGEVEKDFERQVQHHLGKHAITVSSGSAALELAYSLIGISPGDKVVTTPMTCFATNAPLVRLGAKIIWADINMDGNISPESVRECLVEHPDTKAIIVVDWAGSLVNIAAIRRIINELELNIPVVEDAAHRWDTNLTNRFHGDYVAYSMQAIKFMTSGDGGALVTPKSQYARARRLRWFGLDRDNDQTFRSVQDIEESGFKFHMNDIAAAIGTANIAGVCDRLNAHRNNAERILMSIPHLNAIPGSQYWMLPILVDDRNHFIKFMKDRAIECGVVHSRNDDLTCTISSSLPYVSDMSGMDRFSRHQVNIPCGWWLSEEDINQIKDALTEYFGETQ